MDIPVASLLCRIWRFGVSFSLHPSVTAFYAVGSAPDRRLSGHDGPFSTTRLDIGSYANADGGRVVWRYGAACLVYLSSGVTASLVWAFCGCLCYGFRST